MDQTKLQIWRKLLKYVVFGVCCMYSEIQEGRESCYFFIVMTDVQAAEPTENDEPHE
jgi:hypothetical protein